VYVGDLDSKVTNAMLLQTFKQIYQSVVEAKVICDPVSRISKGYGFIKFTNKDESERAMHEMQGKMILGRQIKMNYASQRNKNNQETSNRYANPTSAI
jgi:RNA recognition motif-containing protein